MLSSVALLVLGALPSRGLAFVVPSTDRLPITKSHHGSIRRHDASKSKSFSATATSLRMGLLDLSWGSSSARVDKDRRRGDYDLEIDGEVGSGSYGVVHLCRLSPKAGRGAAEIDSGGDDDDGGGGGVKIAKRAWTEGELTRLARAAAAAEPLDDAALRERADRCRHYIDVERHCLEKLASAADDGARKYAPDLIGAYPDDESKEWLVFDLVGPDGAPGGPRPAPTLSDVLEEDWIDQHARDEADIEDRHRLYVLRKAFGMGEGSSTFGDVLDVALVELLRAVSAVNSCNVVHRDVKPGNLLVHSGGADGGGGSFVLIDFGSAADMDPQSSLAAFGGNGGRVGLDDEGRVALSPIYAAPETFVKWDRAPLNFDAFSSALVFTQLLFNLLDERADASYRQQLEDCDFDLDSWLQRELAAELQPDGMEDAVLYLSERPGMWGVLRGMLHPDSERRISTSEALKQVERILNGSERVSIEKADGKFFAEVVELFDQCELPDSGSAIGVDSVPAAAAAPSFDETPLSASSTEQALVIPRPLHYIATFKRSESLGIILSEVDPDGQYDHDLSEEDTKIWEDATANALPGEVYVRGTVAGGQAEDIGILEVGDKLKGVGEFFFKAEGFDTVVEMLQAQPQFAKTVTLHFSRESVGRSHAYERAESHRAKVEGQGAFQLRGKRKTQEDRFILHEIHDGENAALLAGVFDGHGGDAASITLAQLMPSLLSMELAGITSGAPTAMRAGANDLRDAMESAYEITCRTYRQGCDDEGLCIADYDPREGIVIAGTGSSDVVAGSTVTMSCLSVAEDGADVLSVLNCGDSRTLAFGRPRGGSPKDSVVHFSTRDHSPACDQEMERLALGKNKGYSQPQCSMSRWRMKVGDYQYALARSLEGSFATSKGIVSDPDISMVNLSEMLSERELCSVVLASDGLFEVIDNEQLGLFVIQWREAGLKADEVAKKLCGKALELGSPDNVSAVVLYLS